jgi:D-xylonolactonase
MSSVEVVPVANYHCVTGENPLWNERDGRIYWEDIETGRLFRADHRTLEHECFYQGERLGGFTFQADGTLLLFEVDRISKLEPESGRRTVLLEGIDSGMARFNDVIADPEGRVYAGTFGRDDASGGLFRVDLDGTVTPLWRGTLISNGMGFTGDLKHFYWTCTVPTRTIYVAEYDRASGSLTNRRPFYVAAESDGFPDGMAVDSADTIWTAHWDGHAVVRVGTNGQPLSRLELPVPKVSSVTFGGPELDTLYITTAGGQGLSAGPGADGTLYRASVGVRGRPAFRSRIRL